MRATAVLQKCLKPSFQTMHSARSAVLLKAVDALVAGRRLTLMDVARSWPHALKVRAPLKALDRLLSDPHLHAERVSIYGQIARWVIVQPRPIIIVDWSCKPPLDRRWQLLRAAVPVGGRTLTVLEQIVPYEKFASPKVERQFLVSLRALLPSDARPIVVTDAGFRAPWFRAVEAMGWTWVGRLRHRTQVSPVKDDATPRQWLACKQLYALASPSPWDLHLMDAVRSDPIQCRMVVVGHPPLGRKDKTLSGRSRRRKLSRQNAKRESEPWLIMASPGLDLSPAQLVKIYDQRMQIELSFRDLKSHRYGQGFEDSRTRSAARLQILLLIHMLANFAAWLVGRACANIGLDVWLSPRQSKRRLYSLVRIGREAMVRNWPAGCLAELMKTLLQPPPDLLDQVGVSE